MITELSIEGMSCGHCVVAVGRALKAVPGVTVADADLAAGLARAHHDGSVATETLIAAVEEEGYKAKLAGVD